MTASQQQQCASCSEPSVVPLSSTPPWGIDRCAALVCGSTLACDIHDTVLQRSLCLCFITSAEMLGHRQLFLPCTLSLEQHRYCWIARFCCAYTMYPFCVVVTALVPVASHAVTCLGKWSVCRAAGLIFVQRTSSLAAKPRWRTCHPPTWPLVAFSGGLQMPGTSCPQSGATFQTVPSWAPLSLRCQW